MNTAPALVVGIDFSAPSAALLRHAAHIAKAAGSPVFAVYVLDAGILARRAASGAANPETELLLDQARTKLQEFVDRELPDSNVVAEVRSGRPADELNLAVEEHQASTLVIAANDLTKKRLGSIAARCVRTSPCDVLVMRDWQDAKFSKLIVCMDFAPAASRALARGVELAKADGAELEVVHVMYPPSDDFWDDILDDDESTTTYAETCKEEIDQQMSAVLAPFADDLAGISHRTVVIESKVPSVALTHHIQDGKADLVLLGTHGRSKLASLFLGTNAERLLHDSSVSVMAVRD
ncbi:universal stress protein UspA [Haloferula helveola]|uniref:Universal stress protein UspA n=1 Tax=Haloferula helveola TaxID=490095 RepID=A0ABM7RDP2_9BACT|nr:universal stress protein UspA [Haloferula helveola]